MLVATENSSLTLAKCYVLFFVVEQRKQPHLRGLPTAVVQYNSWKGGGLIAVSYEARKCGVKRY
jgi:nucleotidyltransferase/DNA polymerase involved in DNA repair